MERAVRMRRALTPIFIARRGQPPKNERARERRKTIRSRIPRRIRRRAEKMKRGMKKFILSS